MKELGEISVGQPIPPRTILQREVRFSFPDPNGPAHTTPARGCVTSWDWHHSALLPAHPALSCWWGTRIPVTVGSSLWAPCLVLHGVDGIH